MTTTKDITLDYDEWFISMILLTFLSAMITGSTVQWVFFRGGLFQPSNIDPQQQAPPSKRKPRRGSSIAASGSAAEPSYDRTYNRIVFTAAVSAGILAAGNFLNYCQQFTHYKYNAFLPIFVTICWMIMTHTSIMLVSKKLSMTYRNSDVVYKRLLLINVFMAPVSIIVWITWVATHVTGKETWSDVSQIIEPIQITLWGLVEFVLSGMFIMKMWKFHWTPVERRGIYTLALVAACDLTTVLIYVFMGDVESTVVKAFVYCLRIRLEVGVLSTMADFLQKKLSGAVYAGPSAVLSTSSHIPTLSSTNNKTAWSMRATKSSILNVTMSSGVVGNVITEDDHNKESITASAIMDDLEAASGDLEAQAIITSSDVNDDNQEDHTSTSNSTRTSEEVWIKNVEKSKDGRTDLC